MNNKGKHSDKLPDFLAKMKDQEEGYQVPFNYFDNLENSIMDKIYEEKRIEEEVIEVQSIWQRLFNKPTPVYAFGMMALVIVALFWMIITPEEDLSINTLTAENVEQYIDDNLEDFSYELLEDEISDVETSSLNFDIDGIDPEDIPDEYWDEIDDDDIEEYL